MENRTCDVCGKKLRTRSQIKYCSNKCQSDDRYCKFIKAWKIGKESGGMGVSTKNVSKHIRRYLLEKHNHRCIFCGFNKNNPHTNKSILEIDHIDGDSENNIEKNLRILCPNCHALTSNFKNLNKGKGRKWRKKKYIKNPD